MISIGILWNKNKDGEGNRNPSQWDKILNKMYRPKSEGNLEIMKKEDTNTTFLAKQG